VYGLFASLLKQLTISQPADPYPFLIAALQKPTSVLRAIVTGSGQSGGSRSAQLAHAIQIATTFGVPLINSDLLVQDEVYSVVIHLSLFLSLSLSRPIAVDRLLY
jgi:hypothetical protein